MRARRIFLAIAAIMGLAGCGFQPMYAANPALGAELSDISVSTNEGRAAYLLGLSLRDQLGGWDDRARYRLEASADVRSLNQSVTIADIATREEMRVVARYVLIDTQTGEPVHRGEQTGYAAFDIPNEPYAALRAEQNSQKLAAEDAAQRIAADLARWFNSRETP